MNQEAGAQLQELLKAQADKSIPYLKIDTTQAASSYEAKGNYLVNGEDAITGFAAHYQAGGARISIRNSSVLSQNQGSQSFFVLPLTMAHQVKDGLLHIQSDDVLVEGVQVQTSTQEDGRTVYTVEAK